LQTQKRSIFKPLPRSPQATTVTVRSLIQRVAEGQVRIPPFQRPLRWRGRDVVLLLDSIWRGYPIGSLLCWTRPAAAGQISIGGALWEVPATDSAWWVVDGQQRITALAASLLEVDHGPERTWSVRFDPEQDLFLEGPVPPERQGRDVPASALGDLRRLGQWLRKECVIDDEETLEKIEKLQQKLLDYSIPIYIVDTDDTQTLRAIFARVNSTGARMKAEEVFQALVGSSDDAQNSSTNLSITRIQKAININNFGYIQESEIVKAILAMSGFSPTRRIEDLTDRADQFISARDAENAIKRTILFLIEQCEIPRADLIPYPGNFVILSKWFSLYPDPDQATSRELTRWFWRSAVSAINSRSSAANMNLKIKDIQPGDEQGSLDRLLQGVKKPKSTEWEFEKFNSRNTKSRIEVIFLLSMKPRDEAGIITAEKLSDRKKITKQLINQDLFKNEKIKSQLWKTSANRYIVRSRGLEIDSIHQEEEIKIFHSHLIDEDMLDDIKKGEIISFLKKRTEKNKEWYRVFPRTKSAVGPPADEAATGLF
jgi:hypothetical protein